MATRLKAVIVEDEPGTRALLRLLLASRTDVEVVGEASGLGHAVEVVEAMRPDVVFLDVNLHGKCGFDLIRMTNAPFKTVVMSCLDTHLKRAREIGAVDYLVKPIDRLRLDETFRFLHSADASPT